VLRRLVRVALCSTGAFGAFTVTRTVAGGRADSVVGYPAVMASRCRRAGSVRSKSALQSPAPSENTTLLHVRSGHAAWTSIVCAESALPVTLSASPSFDLPRRVAVITSSGFGLEIRTG
jgi:hypothetical protein